MSIGRLLSAGQLHGLLGSRQALVFDCRSDLTNPAAGREAWLQGHIPGAVFADLDRDLSGPVTAHSGRHPLPGGDDFAHFLARSGWSPGRPVVAYDAHGGALAVRLWWLMRYFGHDLASLLDGGLGAWQAAGYELQAGEHAPSPAAPVKLAAQTGLAMDAAAVRAGLAEQSLLLLDARAADRFAGRNETIDPVAGHVPGAVNRPFHANLDANGRFKPAAGLRAEFDLLLQAHQGQEVAHMCGSGVTACHNLFAMESAGLTGSRLYVGSWSEWIRSPDNPVATAD